MKMQKISPCLWFDRDAEAAARFYTSIFPNSRVTGVTYYGEGMPMPAGTVLTATFELDGQTFTALNGGPQFPFTDAVSFIVTCDSQAEIDRYWQALTDGGQEVECGWLKDQYGLSWQIVPTFLYDVLEEGEPAKTQRVMQTLLQMKKIDLAALERAAAQS